MKKLRVLWIFFAMFVFVPDVLAKSFDCEEVLQFGNSSASVSLFQKMLVDTMKCDMEVDGIFGKRTEECVVSFQKRYDLLVDGIIGKETCSKLMDVYSKRAKKRIFVNAGTVVYAKASRDSSVRGMVSDDKVFTVRGKKTVDGEIWYLVKFHKKYVYVSAFDVFDDFIYVDLSKQELYYYEDGMEELYSLIVTGTKGSHDTPIGHYVLEMANIEENRILSGYNDDGSMYRSHVDYWMPFIMERGIGFHDASWRNDFGGEIYLYSGSHGCINMPYENASRLYELISSDVDVFIVD